MEFLPVLLKEFEKESVATKEMLSRVPTRLFDWQPHPKSMSFKTLATHIADLPSWVEMVLNTDGLNFADTAGYNPPNVASTEELVALYDANYQKGHTALEKAHKEDLEKIWTLKNGDTVLAADNKLETLRMVYAQIVHHRAQLGVFLRLNDIPIPGSYGPSADEGNM